MDDLIDKDLVIIDDEAPVPVVNNGPPRPTLKQKVIKTVWFCVVFILALLVAGGIWLAKEWTGRDTSGYHYKRSCTLPYDVSMDVRGTRKYLNQVHDFMGTRLVDTSNASEETRLDASHEETTVVGITGDQWWSMYNPAAEPRVMILKPADTYIFTQGAKTHVIRYEDFCK